MTAETRHPSRSVEERAPASVEDPGAAGSGQERDEHRGRGPEVVAPTNRITVAFPFSTIHTGEAGADLAELADLVGQLAELVEVAVPGERTVAIRARLAALSGRIS